MRKFFVMLIAILLICTACNNVPDNVVDEFNYQDVKKSDFIQSENQGAADNAAAPTDLAEIEEGCKEAGFDKNNKLIEPEYPLDSDAAYDYGVIMIVKPKSSKNVLYGLPTKRIQRDNHWIKVRDGDKYRRLRPDKIYDEYDRVGDLGFLHRVSHVQTKAEVVEVLYQTEQTNFAPGDTVTVFENYYIVDGRTPKLLDGSNSEEYQIHMRVDWPWYPLETGETYIIFGGYKLWGGEFAPVSEMIYSTMYGIYCLSDPDKQAGFVKSDEITQNGLAYIQEHYPDVYNTYIAQAQ